MAHHAALSRRAPLAARLLGAADTARSTTGITLLPQVAFSIPAVEELVVAALGVPRFKAEIASGRQLTRAEAIRLALGEPAGAGPTGRDASTPSPLSASPLSAREAEIASLVADGLTNKQIASRLFLSERTVDSHVRHILNKLASSSRAQIATWVTARDRDLS